MQKIATKKVLINATSFGSRPSGAKNRFESVYPLALRLQPDAQFVLLISNDYFPPPDICENEAVSTIRLPISSKDKLLRRLIFALIPLISLAVPKFDVIEDLSQPPTLLRSKKRLITIHDIRRLEVSSSIIPRCAYLLSLWVCRWLGTHVITVSREMKKRISLHYPVGLIQVIENSLPVAFAHDGDQSSNFALQFDDYILAVGHLEARKNYINLIDAFLNLSRRWSKMGLVIVGKDNGEEQAIRRLVEKLNLLGRVKILASISDRELVELYRSAQLLVFPSLYEGFGIPLLEAMATDCPLAVSDIDVFHEIAGDAALYFNPNDTSDICSTIDTLIESTELGEYLIRKGREELEKFQPSQIAKKISELYTFETTAK
jgi:glycosyltransferase involved in cell wall biosynthesis